MPVEHHDVIIIGTGAGGGTIARRLAPSGAKILMLERGGFLPRERENWDQRAVFRDARYQAKETWRDGDDKPFSPYTHYWVGGNTKVYGAALLRMRESDFAEVHHFGGVSPAWPISYDDLEPYYTEAERMYSVHGLRGEDPYDPPASSPYPHPPIPHEPRIAELVEDLRTLGRRPFPLPLGLRLDRAMASRAPYHLSNFDGYPDLTEVKADAHVVGVASALAYPNVTLLTNAFAERIVTDRSGREAERVVVLRNGAREEHRAGFVVVACGAVNTAALMLRSANDRHPRGLANHSGVVGRHYMAHNNGLFIAVSSTPNPSRFQKTFGLTDFYRGDEDSRCSLGTIQLMGKLDLDSLAALAKGRIDDATPEGLSERSIDFFLTSEDLPDPENRVTLDDDGTIRIAHRPNNLEAYARLKQRLIQTLDAVDRLRGRSGRSTYLETRLGVSGVSHQNGTMRFGIDPATSALNTDCRAHDLDNLYVADSSFFPSSSAVNPSLTIMANALRVGDQLLKRLGRETRACSCASNISHD